ncbi:MAG: hypothetical protein KDC38_15475, partial [Planctomycetes bacterium]|nr:hypothetical protein [Planctomycetota bacterium]
NFDVAIDDSRHLDLSGAAIVLGDGLLPSELEVMSTDIGLDLAGLERGVGVHPIGRIDISAGSEVTLVDRHDNDGIGADDEVIYVDDLIVESGAMLTTAGYRVYYRTLTLAGAVDDAENLIPLCIPRIVEEPVSATTCEGYPATMTVVAEGAPLTYQWSLDGAEIPGATNATLVIATPTDADVGSYVCEVSTPCGSVTTLAASLTLDTNCAFLRGDTNGDGAFDLSDAIRTLTVLFSIGHSLDCEDAADVNDDGVVDISDAIFTLSALFTGGALPPAPGTITCGVDPTSDALDCEVGCPAS